MKAASSRFSTAGGGVRWGRKDSHGAFAKRIFDAASGSGENEPRVSLAEIVGQHGNAKLIQRFRTAPARRKLDTVAESGVIRAEERVNEEDFRGRHEAFSIWV